MSEEQEQVIRDIFKDPTVTEKVVNALTSTKPQGWSHRSHATYYKAMYAKELKEKVDEMMQNKQDIIYKYSTWCTEKTQYSPQTVYNRVNQSLRYILDQLDPKGIYKEWHETVEVRREKGKGVVISYIPGFGSNDEESPRPEFVEPKNTKPLWMRRLDEWIEDNDNYEPFVKDGLALGTDEIVALKVMLASLPNLQASITQDKVAIIRMS